MGQGKCREIYLLTVDHHLMAKACGIAQTCSNPRRHALKGEGDHGATPPQHITPCMSSLYVSSHSNVLMQKHAGSS